MPRRRLRRTLVVLIAIVGSIAIVFLFRASTWPAENALVGSTETAVHARYGEPKQEFAGHYGLPRLGWTQQFTGDVKSAVFGRIGGDAYVTFDKRNGQWIVISNSYLRRGAAF
jgi:hypothetical protein